jgi:uncharacterized membrane protein
VAPEVRVLLDRATNARQPGEQAMAMRLQEIHPALVHYPIALLPTTLAVDALGRATGDPTLLEMGRRGIALTAGSAAVSALAGLLAQESSRFDGETHDLLVTHRNLNLGLIGLTGWMAARRARRRRPSVGYLLVGLAGMAVMGYSAYLGGHMVYEHGVGIKEAGGLREEEAPKLLPDRVGEVLEVSARHIAEGARHAVEDLANGEVLPWLTRTQPQKETPAFPAPAGSRSGISAGSPPTQG